MVKPAWEVAVVTGGGSGLGRALAHALVARGTRVVVADVVEERAREVAEELGPSALAVPVDVRDPHAMAGLLDTAVSELGPVDLWVNNAGVAVAGLVGDVPLDDWRWVVDVNLWGVVHGCHAVVPHLKARGRGALLNVASAAGLVSTPGMAPYNLTKAAVVSLSETLYAELRPQGIGVTVLCPTFFQTRLLETSRSADAKHARMADRLMQRSKFTSEQVAEAALADVAAGRLFSVPMTDGRLMWAVRRLAPQGFYDLMPRVVRALEGRLNGR